MQKEFNLQVNPEQAANPELLKSAVSRFSGFPASDIRHVEILRRSVDARQRKIRINLRVRVYVQEDFQEQEVTLPDYPDVESAREVVVVGAGPAGLFAALRLIEKGIKPIVLERGKDVRTRRRDLAAITRNHLVNPDSNYCFGEGGAGTYSDGKLYTRSKKRGDVNRILRLLIAHGADKNIAINAHPHIGTNKLPRLIQSIRETILRHGGQIEFNTRVTDLIIQNRCISGVVTQDGTRLECDRVILATGHSARDIFELLHRHGVALEAKPFALGVRVEHSQRAEGGREGGTGVT